MSVDGQRQAIATGLSGTLEPEEAHRVFYFLLRSRNPTEAEKLELSDLECSLHCHYSGLISRLARRYFRAHGQPNQAYISEDDVRQVGSIGFLKALRNFDPWRGVRFTTYAMPTILGEIQHYYRDREYLVRVTPRRLYELNHRAMREYDALALRLGRNPTTKELVETVGVSEKDILRARTLMFAYSPISLDAELDRLDGEKGKRGGGTNRFLFSFLKADDPALQEFEGRLLIEEILGWLPEGRRKNAFLLFFEGKSQAEIARGMGYSQGHVGRLIREAQGMLQRLLCLHYRELLEAIVPSVSLQSRIMERVQAGALWEADKP